MSESIPMYDKLIDEADECINMLELLNKDVDYSEALEKAKKLKVSITELKNETIKRSELLEKLNS